MPDACDDCLNDGMHQLGCDCACHGYPDEEDDEGAAFNDERICQMCDKEATGFASVNGKWYCHGDDDPEPTCYMRAQTRPST